MKRVAVLLFVLMAPAFADQLIDPCKPGDSCYAAAKETSSAETLTLQAVASGTHRHFTPQAATVYCSAACSFTVSQNGTAATTTALTSGTSFTTGFINPLNGGGTPSATVYASSNVGTGTPIAKHSLNDGQTMIVDLSSLFLSPSTANNITVATSTISGTVRIQFYWKESQ